MATKTFCDQCKLEKTVIRIDKGLPLSTDVSTCTVDIKMQSNLFEDLCFDCWSLIVVKTLNTLRSSLGGIDIYEPLPRSV